MMKNLVVSLLALSSCVQPALRLSTPSVGSSSLRSLWVHDGALYAVGPTEGVLYQPAGSDLQAPWLSQEIPSRVALYDVWGDDASLFAVGEKGTILRAVDGAWSAIKSPTTKDLFGIFGDERALYIVGERGLFLRSLDRGQTWTARQLSNDSLRAAWSGMGHLIVVGDSGEILHSVDGGDSWVHDHPSRKALSGVMPMNLVAVYGDETGVYAAGAMGTLLYHPWREGVWQPQDTKTDKDLSSLLGDGHGGIFAVGNHGTLVRGAAGRFNSTQRGELGDLHDARMVGGVVFLLNSEGLLFKEESSLVGPSLRLICN